MNFLFAMLSFVDRERGAETIRYLHPHLDSCIAHFLDGIIRNHRQAVQSGIMHDVFDAVELMVGTRTLSNPRVEFLRMVNEHCIARKKGKEVDSKWLSTLAHRFVELESATTTVGWMKYEYAMSTLLLSPKEHHPPRALELFAKGAAATDLLPETERHVAFSRLLKAKAMACLRLNNASEALGAWREAAMASLRHYKTVRAGGDAAATLDAAADALLFRWEFHEHEAFRQFREMECGVTDGMKAELVAAHPSLDDPPC